MAPMLRDALVKFTRELTGTLTIQTVTSAAIIVSGDSYSEPVALTPDEIVDGWEPLPIADLTEAHFEDLLSRSPELVILGTGASSQFPPRELVFAFARRGIGLETMDTPAAARTFNVLATEGRQVAAVLYL